MGKLVEPTHYKLVFETGPLQGAQVTVASMSVRETWAYNDALGELADIDARYRFMVNTLAPLIVSWDLEKAPGEAWPLTLDGVLSLPDNWLPDIVTGWLKAINGTPDPTGTAGEAALDPIEASLPMDILEPGA